MKQSFLKYFISFLITSQSSANSRHTIGITYISYYTLIGNTSATAVVNIVISCEQTHARHRPYGTEDEKNRPAIDHYNRNILYSIVQLSHSPIDMIDTHIVF